MHPTHIPLRSLPAALAVVGFLLLGSATARAQIVATWNTDANGNWSESAKWLPATVPGTAAGDSAYLTYQITTTRTITLDTNATLGVLEIGDLSGGSSYTLSGSSQLIFDWNGATAGNAFLRKINDGGNDTISVPVRLDDTLEISVFDPTANQILSLSGIISDGANSAPGNGKTSIVINNSDFYGVDPNRVDWGIVLLTGQNTFSGQMLVQSGTLRVEGVNDGTTNSVLGALGLGNETRVSQGGRIDLRDRDLARDGQEATEIFRIAGTGLNGFGGNPERGGLGALFNTSGTAQISHLALDDDATVGGYSTLQVEDRTDGSSAKVNGILDGGGFTLTKRGSNYLILKDTDIANLKTIDVTENTLRLLGSTLLEAGDFSDGGINLFYDPDAFSEGLGGTRTSDPYGPSTAANGDFTGNSLLEARVEFYVDGLSGDVTHSADLNLNRGSILRGGTTAAATPATNTILSGTINLVGGVEVPMNVFSIEGGSSGVGDAPGALVISGLIDNTSVGNAGVGFTKRGGRELRIISDQSAFDGDILIHQTTQNLPLSNTTGAAQPYIYGITLAEDGALSALGAGRSITLGRRSSLNIDNTAKNVTDRISDDAEVILRNSYLHLTGNASVATTETLGAVTSEIGINSVMLNSRAGGAIDITIDSLNLRHGSVFQIVDLNTGATFGVAPGDDRVAIGNAGSLALVGNASGTTDRAIIPGVLGGVVASATPAAGRAQEYLDNYMALYTGNRFMTIDNSGGVDYLRPLLDSEFNTTPGAGDNWRVTGTQGNAGTRDNAANVASDIAVNSLFIDDLGYRTTAQDHVVIGPGKTLTIDSGMISFGTFGGSYASTSNESVIRGGFLDMNGSAATLNNGMRWHDTDNDNVTGNNAFVRSHIINSDGLVKVGRNNIYLDTWNRFDAGSDGYVAEDGYLVVRNDRSLAGLDRLYVSGSGNFLLDQGVDLRGVDLWVLPSDTGDRTALRAENYQNSWRGDVILDTLDGGGSNEYRRTLLTANSDDALNIYGDIYTSKGLPGAQSATVMTDSDAWNDPFRVSTSNGAAGTINLHGSVGDVWAADGAAALDLEVNAFETTAGVRYSNNYALSFEMTGHDEINVNVFRQWEATGRLELDRGYFRIHYDPAGQTGATEGFLTDDARARITPNAYWTRLAMGNDGSGTGTASSHLMLARDGQLMNWPNIYLYNNDPLGTLTIGGENMSGTVYIGSRDNSVSSGIQYASQGATPAERDLRLYQAPGGTMVINAQLDDESNEGGLLSIASKIGSGTVRLNDNPKGASDVQAWNVMGGTLEWVWRSAGSGNDRFARADANDNGARLLLGGGALHAIGGTDANRDQDLPGARFALLSGGSDLWVTSQSGRTTRLTVGRASGTSFFRSPGSLLGVIEEENGGIAQIQLNVSGTATGSFGSLLGATIVPWATYTNTPGTVDSFLSTSGSEAIVTPGAAHTDGLGEGNYSGTNTNVTADLTFTADASPSTLRFNTDDRYLHLDTHKMTVANGGVLVTSSVTTGAGVVGGTLTSGFDANGNAAGSVRDLMIHNHGTGTLLIASSIADNGADALNLVLGGTGVTRLTGANSHTGGTFLVGGTVEIGADSALGTAPGAIDADNLYFNGGTLRPTQSLAINADRGITLGGEGATFEIGAGLQLDYGGVIASETNYQSAANGYGRTLAYNPDFGDVIKTGDGVLNLAPNANSTYTGLTLVRDGTLRVTTPATANTSATYDLLGTDQSWTDGTIVEGGATLEINFTGTTSAGDWVNQEWIALSGDGHDGGGALRTVGLGRAFSTTGQIYVDGTTRFNLTAGYVYLANGGGYLASLDADPGTPDDIIVQGAGNWHLYSNAPDWYGSLTLVNQYARIYNGASLPNMTSLTMQRNNYLEIQSVSSSVDQYRDQLPDGMPILMSGRPRLRLNSGTNTVYSGFQRTGALSALLGEPAIQFDSAMDLSASTPGQTLPSNTWAGFLFDEIARAPGALVRFHLLDSIPQAWTDLADVKSAVDAGWADSTFGASVFEDVVTVAVSTAPVTVGAQITAEAPDRAIVPGFLGGTRLPYIDANSTSQRDDENYYARRAMTVDGALDPDTGAALTILRPLKTSEYTTLANPGTDAKNGIALDSLAVTGAQDNLRLVGLISDTRGSQATYLTNRRDSIVYLQEDLAINSLAFEQDSYISDNATSAGTSRGNMVSLDIGLGRTLTIDSGQIVVAATATSDRGGAAYDGNRNQYNWSFIHGGDLDFNGREAILVNNSLWQHYDTADSVEGYRAADGDYSEFYIGSSIRNANGLTKGGAAPIHLMMPNEIDGPVHVDYGSLYARHDQALGGATEIAVTGGNFIVASGASIQGVDIHYRLPDADRIALQLEQSSIFGGDLIIHNVDAAGSANVNNAAARALLRSSNSVGSMAGDVYGSDDPISNLVAATQPRLVSTNGSGANGTLWFRGVFADKWDATGDLPVVVDPNASPNEVLRFEIAGSDTFQLWIDQPWHAAGRIEHERGYVRYLGAGDFWHADAAALVDPSSPASGYVMGGDTATGNAQLCLLLTRDGQRFNIPSWQVGDEISNTTGNILLGGGNMSGTVSFGTGAGSITFYSRSASYDRDLTLVAARGGEVEIDANLVDGGANVNSSITKIRPGTVLLNGSSAGAGTVEGVNVMGGVLVLQNYGAHDDRRVGQGATLTGGGGALAMFNDDPVSPTENLTGAVTIAPGASAVAVINANVGVTTMNLGNLTRNAGGAMAFIEQDAGFGSAVLRSTSGSGQPADTRIGSWAVYGTQAYNLGNGQVDPIVGDWAAYDGGNGITAFSGYSNDTFGAGLQTNIVTDQLLGGATNTGSVRFAQAGATQIDVNGSALTLDDGGILVATNTGAASILDGSGGGGLVGGGGELIVHNYGSGGLTITADIGGSQSFTHAGTGTTTLGGTNSYTGTSYLNQGTVVVDSLARLGTGALYLGGATLRHTGTGTETITRNITLGDSGAVIRMDDAGLVLANRVTIASEANVIGGYGANPLSGSLDITGPGTFTMGDSTAASTVTDLAGVNNTYQGLTVIGDGTSPTVVRVEGQPGDYAYVTPFGAPDTFLNSTQIRNGATLAFSPKLGDGSRDNEVRYREWLVFGEGATDTTYLVKDTNRTIDLIGVIGVNGTLEIKVSSNTLRLGLYENGYLIGDASSKIIKAGANARTLEVRESSPEYKGSWEIREGSLSLYGIGAPAGTGTAPIILGDTTGTATGLNRLWVLSEYGSNDDTGYNGMSDDLHLSHDIVITGNSSQDHRIGSGYLPADGAAVTFHGDIEIQSVGSGGRAFYMEYEDTEGLSEAYTGHLQHVYLNYLGDISTSGAGAQGFIEAYLGAGSANDDHDMFATFVLGGDNTGWNGEFRVSNNTGATYDRDENVILRLANENALDADNTVRMRNQSTLQVGGRTVTIGGLITETGIAGDPSGAGFNPQTSGTNLITDGVSAIIENASSAPGNLTIAQNNTADAVSWNALFRDGPTEARYDPIGSTPAPLSITKIGAGVAVMTVANLYTGATTVREGALVLDFTSSDNSMLSDTGTLTLGTAALQLDRDSGAGGTHTEVVGATTLDGVASVTRGAGSTAVLQMNAITVNPGASVSFGADNIASTDTLNTNGILGAWATAGGSWAVNSTDGADGLIVGLAAFGQNIDRLQGGAGTQVISDGDTDNVNIVEDGAVTNPITLAVSGGTTNVYTLRQGAAGGEAVVDIGAGNTLRVASGGILLPDGSGALTFAPDGTLTAGTGTVAATLRIQNQDTAAALTVGATIADNGPGTLDVRTSGPGTTVFTGANTYTGATVVGSGRLAVGDGNATGTLGGGDVTIEALGTLAFHRSDAALSVTNPLLGTGTVMQSGTGTTTLSAASPLSSLTFTMADGTLATGVDDAIRTTGDLVFGATTGAATVGALNLGASATGGGLLVQTNTAAANAMAIATGETLTTNGDVTVGFDGTPATDPAVTSFTVSGGGAWVVTRAGGTFQVGGATTNEYGNVATLDMSGLDTFTADLGAAGTFRVGDNAGSASGAGSDPSTATLADVSTITAGRIGVGDAKGVGAGVATLRLGSTSNALNADRIVLGDYLLGRRGSGVIVFDTAAGTLRVRGSDGVGRADMDVLNSNSGTGYALSGTVNLAGHASDLLLGDLSIGLRSAGSGPGTGTFTFDAGTLDVTAVALGQKAGGAGTNTVSGTLNVGGGDVTVGAGGISMGFNGGTEASTASGTLNFTGGTIAVGGDITRGGTTGPGASNATLNLDGASLDMLGNEIGDAANPLTTVFASGSLSNVAEINGGGVLTKTTTGTLALVGPNSYTGATVIDAGTLQAAASNAMGYTASIAVQSTGSLLLSGGDPGRVNDLAGVTLDGSGQTAIGNVRVDNDAGDIDETLGALTLSSNSIIDMGTGGYQSLLRFAGDGAAWASTLTIWNWNGTPIGGDGPDGIFFGTDNGGNLTPGWVSNVHFYSDAGTTPIGTPGDNYYLGDGELVPVPEPGTGIAALLLIGLVLLAERRARARGALARAPSTTR